MVTTGVITRDEDLRALVEDWTRLWSRDVAATPFQHPSWLLAWWRAFHPGTLTVLTVYDGSELIALAPLYREASASNPRLMPIGVSLSDYTDVLVCPEHRTAGLAGVADMLASELREVRRVDWDDVGPFGHVLALSLQPGLTCASDEVSSPCPVLVLPTAGQTLASVLPARKLRKLRMARNRLQRRSHDVVRHTAASCSSFVAALADLHTARWRSRGEPGLLADPAISAFLLDALPGLLAQGCVHATTLSIDGVLASAYLGFRSRTFACAYMGGFHPEFAFESPGTVLLGDAMDEAVARGALEFHFLRGAEAYKYEWGATDRMNHRISLTAACFPRD